MKPNDDFKHGWQWRATSALIGKALSKLKKDWMKADNIADLERCERTINTLLRVRYFRNKNRKERAAFLNEIETAFSEAAAELDKKTPDTRAQGFSPDSLDQFADLTNKVLMLRNYLKKNRPNWEPPNRKLDKWLDEIETRVQANMAQNDSA